MQLNQSRPRTQEYADTFFDADGHRQLQGRALLRKGLLRRGWFLPRGPSHLSFLVGAEGLPHTTTRTAIVLSSVVFKDVLAVLSSESASYPEL